MEAKEMKRKDSKTTKLTLPVSDIGDAEETDAAIPVDGTSPIDELNLLVRRAEAGDESVLPGIRRLLSGRPDIWKSWGDLYTRAVNKWATLASGRNLMTRECVLRKVMQVREALIEAPGSPLEELLAQQVALSWLQTTWAAAMYAEQGMLNPSLPILQFADKRMDSAQRRLLAATKQLAIVRKLLKPSPSTLELIGGASKESKPKFGGRLAGMEAAGVN